MAALVFDCKVAHNCFLARLRLFQQLLLKKPSVTYLTLISPCRMVLKT